MINLKELAEMLEKEGIKHQNMMNGNRPGLEIGDKEMRPVIYADRFDDVHEALKFAKELYAMGEPAFKETLFDKLGDPNFIKENLKLGIRPVTHDDVATRDFADLQLYAYLRLSEHEGNVYMTSIREQHLEALGLTEGELFGNAVNNTWYTVRPITEDMKDILVKEGLNETVAEMMVSTNADVQMYVVTTPNQFRGASALANNLCMYELAETLDADLIIFSSSIHELIIVPEQEDEDPERLRTMVKEINSTEVEPSEFLSNNVYRFSRETGKITII